MEILNNLPQRWMKDHIILLGITGSHAYGTATEDSDIDYKGICIPPVHYFLGLESFNEYNNTGSKNFKNTAGDIDVSILHINKFVKDAMQGVPNNIEMLFLDQQDYVYVNDYGQALIEIRQQFLSKRIIQKFSGYAKSQAQKLKNMQSNGAARKELVERFEYDSKFYMHTVRLLTSAIDILQDGTFTTRRPNADFLVSLRNGAHSLTEALAYIAELESALQHAYLQTQLPEEPDYDEINKWLVHLNMQFILEQYERP